MDEKYRWLLDPAPSHECLNVTETKAFSSTVSKKEYKINHKFNCSDKFLIYLLTCNKCMLQYLGKTGQISA